MKRSFVDKNFGHIYTLAHFMQCMLMSSSDHCACTFSKCIFFSAKTAWPKPLWLFAFVENIHHSAGANHQITKKEANNNLPLLATSLLIIWAFGSMSFSIISHTRSLLEEDVDNLITSQSWADLMHPASRLCLNSGLRSVSIYPLRPGRLTYDLMSSTSVPTD